jgi:hypothetical protein
VVAEMNTSACARMMCRCYVKPWGQANKIVAMQLTTFPKQKPPSSADTLDKMIPFVHT